MKYNIATNGFALSVLLVPTVITSVFVLPPLPYGYSALSPFIDKKTMQLHHDKHHQKYVDELNKALKDYPELQKKTVRELIIDWKTLPESIRTQVRNNAGGHLNHSLFWQWMTPHKKYTKPTGSLKDAIIKQFGSIEKFKKEFNAAALKVFGSGWAWLCINDDNKLVITTTANQDNPITDGLEPVFGLDVWEHAYYLKYNNRRNDYIDSWWKIANWHTAQQLYDKALSS